LILSVASFEHILNLARYAVYTEIEKAVLCFGRKGIISRTVEYGTPKHNQYHFNRAEIERIVAKEQSGGNVFIYAFHAHPFKSIAPSLKRNNKGDLHASLTKTQWISEVLATHVEAIEMIGTIVEGELIIAGFHFTKGVDIKEDVYFFKVEVIEAYGQYVIQQYAQYGIDIIPVCISINDREVQLLDNLLVREAMKAKHGSSAGEKNSGVVSSPAGKDATDPTPALLKKLLPYQIPQELVNKFVQQYQQKATVSNLKFQFFLWCKNRNLPQHIIPNTNQVIPGEQISNVFLEKVFAQPGQYFNSHGSIRLQIKQGDKFIDLPNYYIINGNETLYIDLKPWSPRLLKKILPDIKSVVDEFQDKQEPIHQKTSSPITTAGDDSASPAVAEQGTPCRLAQRVSLFWLKGWASSPAANSLRGRWYSFYSGTCMYTCLTKEQFEFMHQDLSIKWRVYVGTSDEIIVEPETRLWPFRDSSLERVNTNLKTRSAYAGRTLEEEILHCAENAQRSNARDKVIVVDWACESAKALIEIAEFLQARNITNVRLIGFDYAFHPNWLNVEGEIDFILGPEQLLIECLNQERLNRIRVYSHHGIAHLTEEIDKFRQHMSALCLCLRPDGDILFNYDPKRTTPITFMQGLSGYRTVFDEAPVIRLMRKCNSFHLGYKEILSGSSSPAQYRAAIPYSPRHTLYEGETRRSVFAPWFAADVFIPMPIIDIAGEVSWVKQVSKKEGVKEPYMVRLVYAGETRQPDGAVNATYYVYAISLDDYFYWINPYVRHPEHNRYFIGQVGLTFDAQGVLLSSGRHHDIKVNAEYPWMQTFILSHVQRLYGQRFHDRNPLLGFQLRSFGNVIKADESIGALDCLRPGQLRNLFLAGYESGRIRFQSGYATWKKHSGKHKVRVGGTLILRRVEGRWCLLLGRRNSDAEDYPDYYTVPTGSVSEPLGICERLARTTEYALIQRLRGMGILLAQDDDPSAKMESVWEAALRETYEEVEELVTPAIICGRVNDFFGLSRRILISLFVIVDYCTGKEVLATYELKDYVWVPLDIILSAHSVEAGAAVERYIRRFYPKRKMIKELRDVGIAHFKQFLHAAFSVLPTGSLGSSPLRGRDAAAKKASSPAGDEEEIMIPLSSDYGITPVIQRLIGEGYVTQEEFLAMRERVAGHIDQHVNEYELRGPRFGGTSMNRLAVVDNWIAFWSTLYAGPAAVAGAHIHPKFFGLYGPYQRPDIITAAGVIKVCPMNYDIYLLNPKESIRLWPPGGRTLDEKFMQKDRESGRTAERSFLEFTYAAEAFHAVEDLFREILDIPDVDREQFRQKISSSGKEWRETNEYLHYLGLGTEEAARAEAGEDIHRLMIWEDSQIPRKTEFIGGKVISQHDLAYIVSDTVEQAVNGWLSQNVRMPGNPRKLFLRFLQANSLLILERLVLSEDKKDYSRILSSLIPRREVLQRSLMRHWPQGRRLASVAMMYQRLRTPLDLYDFLLALLTRHHHRILSAVAHEMIDELIRVVKEEKTQFISLNLTGNSQLEVSSPADLVREFASSIVLEFMRTKELENQRTSELMEVSSPAEEKREMASSPTRGFRWKNAAKVPWREMVRCLKEQPNGPNKSEFVVNSYGDINRQRAYRVNQKDIRKIFLEFFRNIEHADIDTFQACLSRMHVVFSEGIDGKTLYMPKTAEEWEGSEKINGNIGAVLGTDYRLNTALKILKLFNKRYGIGGKPFDANGAKLVGRFYSIIMPSEKNGYLFVSGTNSIVMNIVNALLRLVGLRGIEHGDLDFMIERCYLDFIIDRCRHGQPNFKDFDDNFLFLIQEANPRWLNISEAVSSEASSPAEKIYRTVPVLGALVGGLGNYSLIDRLMGLARREEEWLVKIIGIGIGRR
jgi:8-oxo-dGTP pyrophosphatase MutT (NUDIX family)